MKTFNPQKFLALHSARRHRARRRGTVTLLVALGIVMILGFASMAVDYGVISNDANQLQRAADAAALAGSQTLPDPIRSEVVAKDVAARNFVPNVSPNTVTVSFNADFSRITVVCTRNRPLYFARIFGINNSQLSRRAVVARAQNAPPRIVPIGVTQETYDAMKAAPLVPRLVSYVRPTDTQYALDNFIVFDLRGQNAKSPSHMATQLKEGAFDVNIGDRYTSLNSSTGPVDTNFKDALSTIFQRSSQAPWNDTWTGNLNTSVGIRFTQIELGTSPYDNPRVMRLVVNPNSGTPTGGGTWDVPVIDFAPVYLEAYSEIPQADGTMRPVVTIRLLTTNNGMGGTTVTMVQ